MSAALPQGWTIDEEIEDEKPASKLPAGWTVEESNPVKETTAKERDEAKLKQEAGAYAVEEKTPEELKKMSIAEKMQYMEDLKTQREFLQSSFFTKQALSGLTFGATKNIEALKPVELEEFTPYSLYGAAGELSGSFLPLSKMINVFKGPAMKLASKSPVFQKQLSSLATMFGVGATTKTIESLAKGEMPTQDEVLEHGVEWAALDALLQTAGSTGKFVSSLLKRSKSTGISRKDLVNNVYREVAESGVDMNNAEEVSAKVMEILEKPVTEEELIQGQRQKLTEESAGDVEKLAQETLKQEPVTPKDLKSRKITDEPVNKLTSESISLSEPYQPREINFTQEAETLAKDAIEQKIESTGTRAATEEELGNAIREDVEATLEAAKQEYRPLYNQAEEAAEGLYHTPSKTALEGGEKLRKMSQLKTKPAGYSSVLSTLENVLEDAGFVINRNEKGAIERIIQDKEVPVQKTMELARRLNEIIDYEAVEPSVKDALRSVVRGAKADIREGLAQNSEALAAFEMAEAEHARVAKKYGRESIRKIRGTQAGEKISKMAESPTTLGELREVLSPQQMMQVEREMLEKLNNQSFEKAQKSLREMERHLSEENRKLAREIVEAKNPHNPQALKKTTQEGILNDMSTALTNGTRPEKTLALWKTPKGQKLVKETFHNSPNWPQVKGYLEKQSFNDMASSVLKDGKLDLKKFNEFMRDPTTVNNIRAQGGEEAVTFFQELNSNVKKIQDNAKLLEKLPTKEQVQRGKKFSRESYGQGKLQKGVDRSKRIREDILDRIERKEHPIQSRIKDWKEWTKEMLGLNSQSAMSIFGISKLGGAAIGAYAFGIPNAVATMIGFKLLEKMMTSPKVRKAFLDASKQYTNPIPFILSMKELGESMEE